MTQFADYERGVQLFELGRYKEAIEYFNKSLQGNPNGFDSKYYLALSYYNIEDYKRASELVEVLISEEPDNADVFFLKSRIAFQQDDNNKALNLINTAISLNPHEEEYFGLKAAIFLDMKRYEEALVIVNEGLKINSQNTLCLNIRAQVLTKLDRKDEAEETIENILHENPEDNYSHANVGWVSLENGQIKKALEHFRTALQRNPNFDYARQGMSTALKSKNFLYRLYLKYSFWIGNKSSKNQWVFIIGIYLVYRFSVKMLSASGLSYLAYPIIIAYLLFALGAWIMEPLSNFILIFDKYGKYLLNKQQEISGLTFGSLLTLSIVSAILFFVLGSNMFLLFSIVFLCTLVPLPQAFLEEGNSKTFKLVYGFSMLAIGLIAPLFINNLFAVGGIVFLMMVIYTWIGNAI